LVKKGGWVHGVSYQPLFKLVWNVNQFDYREMTDHAMYLPQVDEE
jgi:hypothetical protein